VCGVTEYRERIESQLADARARLAAASTATQDQQAYADIYRLQDIERILRTVIKECGSH
jgi:hypothetical protein